MSSENQQLVNEFKNIKNHIKKNIISFLKNELNLPEYNINDVNTSKKINHISNDVFKNLNSWMMGDIPNRYKKIVLNYINENRWSEIIEAFKQELIFGTSGIRGKLVVSLDKKNCEDELKSLNELGFKSEILRGTNSINEITILKNICGLINYMNKKKYSKVVVGYDSRVCSKLFSILITNLLLQKKFFVFLFDEFNSLPELSHAVTYFGADMGIEVTASHNDKRYNGYKLITSSGSPPSAEIREEISSEIFNNYDEIPYELLSLNYNDFCKVKSENLTIIKKSSSLESQNNYEVNITDDYLNQILNLIDDKDIVNNFSSKLSIGYSALHGTGYSSVSKLFQKLGINNVKYISNMIQSNSLFPLFDYKQILDPSDIDAANVVVSAFTEQFSKEEFNQLDFLCYTDPDADRLGIIVKVSEKNNSISEDWRLLKANDVWTLLLWYILEKFQKNSNKKFLNPKKLFIVKSFVTSDSLEFLSKKFHVDCINGKVGFSDLTEKVQKRWKENKINIGMFEESCGFGIAGNHKDSSLKMHILEKDGLLALSFLIEILCYAKSQNTSIMEILDDIYSDPEIGYFCTYRKELPEHDIFEGIKGELQLEQILKNVENFCMEANEKIKLNNPIMICGLPISKIEKFSTGRYDSKFWKGFPDEGIRFYLDSKTNHITIRSSGTEPKLRIFVQYRVNPIKKENIIENKIYAENFVKKLSEHIQQLILF